MNSVTTATKLDFANLQGECSYQFFKTYQRSKTAGLLFAFELARRLEGTNATSNAVSPGPTKTAFGNNMTGVLGLFLRTMKRIPIFGTAEKGAQTLVYAAVEPGLAGVSGRFFFKSRVVPPLLGQHALEGSLVVIETLIGAA
jgi:retinol dehydrogenase 14